MRISVRASQVYFPGSIAGSLLAISTCGALAGGFENEQSTYFQGLALAGLAAGGPSISSIFSNPAASAFAENGLTMESGYQLILPRADVTVDTVGGVPPLTGTEDADIGRDALTAVSFATWRLNDKTVFGMSMTSPWGLGSKPDNAEWAGKPLSATGKLFSLNVTPSVSYAVVPGVAVGVGVQFEYLNLLRQTASTPIGTSNLEGDDIGIGFTAGVNLSPASGTSIGLGFRSSIDHKLEGHTTILGVAKARAEGDIQLPEKITLSMRQVVSPATRLLGTVEWTNWSRLGVIPIVLKGPFLGSNAGDTIANFDFRWRDGWLFALGGEYDWSRVLTLQAGAAYEISPVDDPTTRLAQIPDSNRVWATVGSSYKWSDTITVNFAYMHMFYQNDAPFDRVPATALMPQPQDHILGTADLSLDIVSISMKMRMGVPSSAPQALK